MAPILPNHCSRRCDAMRQSERKRDTRYSGIARIPGDFRNGRSNGAETSCPPPPLSLSFPLLSSPPLVASPPSSSVFSSAGTPDFHPESRESAERPAVFDTYVGNDRNFQPMKFERRGFAVRGWPGADRRLASITIRIRRPTRHLHNLPPVIARLLENIIISNR